MATNFRTNRAFAAGIAAALATAFAVPAAAKSTSAPAAEVKEDGKVCIAAAAGASDGQVTGSIMKRKVCRTKAKWLAEGVTFDDNGKVIATKN